MLRIASTQAQMDPTAEPDIAGLIGGGVLSLPFLIVGLCIFILCVMWIIFPWLMYSQLNDVQRHLLQIHADLVELNHRVKDATPPERRNPRVGPNDTGNPFG